MIPLKKHVAPMPCPMLWFMFGFMSNDTKMSIAVKFIWEEYTHVWSFDAHIYKKHNVYNRS